MRVDVVVARYGEDLSWLKVLPETWRRVVYDKSFGGPRDDQFRELPGPNAAAVWPGAIRRPNVGFEAETYLWHVAAHYDDLADLTVFLQGDAPRHAPDIQSVARVAELPWGFVQYGPVLHCDRLGRPQHPDGLPELQGMAEVFGLELPERLAFKPWALFAARRATLRDVSLARWTTAASRCVTKSHACAMERLWGLLLDQPVNRSRRRGPDTGSERHHHGTDHRGPARPVHGSRSGNR